VCAPIWNPAFTGEWDELFMSVTSRSAPAATFSTASPVNASPPPEVESSARALMSDGPNDRAAAEQCEAHIGTDSKRFAERVVDATRDRQRAARRRAAAAEPEGPEVTAIEDEQMRVAERQVAAKAFEALGSCRPRGHRERDQNHPRHAFRSVMH
jgi:hypothetical protein